jgi:urease accessory protein
VKLTRILGHANDPEIAEHLHLLGHRNRIEHIDLDREDTMRHRLRTTTDAGTDCAIALPRSENLMEGAVLLLEDDRAIVIRMNEENWLTLEPRDTACALELGYFAGNLHWRVKFDGPRIRIALEAPERSYLDRLAGFLSSGKARRSEND